MLPLRFEQIHNQPVAVLDEQNLAGMNHRVIIPGIAVMAGKGIVILFIRLKIPDPAGSSSRRIPVEAADMLILSVYNYCIVGPGRYRVFTLLVPFEQPHS
ncbi:hypothetical protein D3C79_1011060 [compost metagenome]